MSNLLDQLQRESDDLCGHRGLTPGTNLSLDKIHNFLMVKSEPEPNIHSNFIVSRLGSSNLFNELTNPVAGLLRQGCYSGCGFRYTGNVL